MLHLFRDVFYLSTVLCMYIMLLIFNIIQYTKVLEVKLIYLALMSVCLLVGWSIDRLEKRGRCLLSHPVLSFE